MSKDRSSNFELLRLLCIFGILMMHTFGGIDTSVSFFNTEIHVLVNSVFNMGVTCFILLSGYFGIRFDFKKLIRLDLMIIFFTIFGTIAVGNLGIKALIKSCIPVISRYYWFISCYFFLCFLTPFLNQIPEKLSKENFEKLLAVLLLLFSVIPTFGFFEIMQDGGKGLVHMVMIYLLGRYLALYHNRSHNTGRLFLGLFLSIGFIFLADSSLTFVRGKLYTTFCRDCSIFIIFGSVMVLLLFRELNFHSRFINRAAGNVLAVYVLDGTVQTFLLKWIDFKPYAGSWFLVFLAIGYALAIMIIACLLNEVRKATIGRLEPWLVNVVNAVVMWGVNAVRGVVRKLIDYFLALCFCFSRKRRKKVCLSALCNLPFTNPDTPFVPNIQSLFPLQQFPEYR